MRGQGRHRVRSRPRTRVLRVAVVLLAVAGAAAFTAFGSSYLDHSAARADEKFVAAAAAQGRPVQSGDQTLVIQAARKLCESHSGVTTSTERRATVLSSDEVDAVHRTFGDDTSAFVKVAKSSYCPLNR